MSANERDDQPDLPPLPNRFWWLLTIGIVLCIGVVGAFAGRNRTNRSSHLVFISRIENRTGDAAYDTIATAATNLILRRISNVIAAADSHVNARGAKIVRADSPRAVLDRWGMKMAAGTFVSGELYRERGALRLQARVIDKARRQPAWPLPPVTIPQNSFDPEIREVAERTTGAIAVLFTNWYADRIPHLSPPPRYDAYLVYLSGVYGDLNQDSATTARKIANLERSAVVDSTFKFGLIEAAMRMGSKPAHSRAIIEQLEKRKGDLSQEAQLRVDVMSSWLTGDRGKQYRAISRLNALAPRRYELEFSVFAERFHRPAEALRTHYEMNETLPDSQQSPPYNFYAISPLLHELGRYQDDLELAMQVRRKYRGNMCCVQPQVQAFVALGRVNELLALMDTLSRSPVTAFAPPGVTMLFAAQELRAHGYQKAARETAERTLKWYEHSPDTTSNTAFVVATAHYEAQHWPVARTATLELEKRISTDRGWYISLQNVPTDGQLPWIYGRLGAIAARQNDRPTAEHYLQQLASLPDSNSTREYVLMARARITALLGDQNGAMQLLRQAVGDQGIDLHADMDFESLKNNREFQEFIRPKG